MMAREDLLVVIGTAIDRHETGDLGCDEAVSLLRDALELLQAMNQPPAPDWSRAQPWASFWAVNADGKAYWFPAEPVMVNGKWTAEQSGYYGTFDRHLPYLGWETSLHRRPALQP
jgi:hypothetical protein